MIDLIFPDLNSRYSVPKGCVILGFTSKVSEGHYIQFFESTDITESVVFQPSDQYFVQMHLKNDKTLFADAISMNLSQRAKFLPRTTQPYVVTITEYLLLSTYPIQTPLMIVDK